MNGTRRAHVLPAIVLIAAGALGTTVGCRGPIQGNGANVLLITYETTRADHLGCYGYERDTSPRIDALASRGVLFERAISASPRTNPSLASLMTATYPHEHGVRNLLLPLEPEHRTIAEVFRDAGYETGAVQTHPRLVRSSGFEQGFRRYDDDVAGHPLADQAVDTAIEWIRSQGGGSRPWFFWLHLMDPHWTYDPPRGWREAFGPEHPTPSKIYRALSAREITIGPIVYRNAMTPREVQGFVDFYDGEIRYTDQAVGRLLEALTATQPDGNTVVVMTADHGESLGENHYFFEHGAFGGEAEIHVPLIVSAPGKLPEGIRVPATVRSIDVAPSILELAGLDPPPSFRGQSLLPLIGGPSEDRSCFGETGKVFHEENTVREVSGLAGKWRWIRHGRFKIVHRPRTGGITDRVLYDVESEQGETLDVSDRHPEVFARLSAELDAILREDTEPAREYHISEEAREQLRSLGYVN